MPPLTPTLRRLRDALPVERFATVDELRELAWTRVGMRAPQRSLIYNYILLLRDAGVMIDRRVRYGYRLMEVGGE